MGGLHPARVGGWTAVEVRVTNWWMRDEELAVAYGDGVTHSSQLSYWDQIECVSTACVCSSTLKKKIKKKSNPICNPYLGERGQTKVRVCLSLLSLSMFTLCARIAKPSLLSSGTLLIFQHTGAREKQPGEGGGWNGDTKLRMCQFSLASAWPKQPSAGGQRGEKDAG